MDADADMELVSADGSEAVEPASVPEDDQVLDETELTIEVKRVLNA